MKHLPSLIVGSVSGAGRIPPQVVKLMALQQRGKMLEISLHGPLNTDQVIRDAEEWWDALPADTRDEATAWAEGGVARE